MNLTRLSAFVALLLVPFFAFSPQSLAHPGAVTAPPATRGGLILYTVPPRTVCVGDTFTVEGGGFVDMPEEPPTGPGQIPLAPLVVMHITITAAVGSVSPDNIVESTDDAYFSFTYTAKAEGDETIKAVLNGGLALDTLRFKVEKSCTYDAFLTSVLDFTSSGDLAVHTLTDVTGTGTMQRARSTEDILQGNGTWHLEENILNAPPDCVTWFIPPLILSGPFELDAQLNPQEESLSVILSFQPRSGPPVYHGKSICTYADGSQGEGWGIITSGGDTSMLAKIQADFPTGGGSQPVELTGAGVNKVQAAGSLEYTATLTIIPH